MSHKLDDITLYYYPEGKEALTFTKRQNVISGLYVNSLDGYKPKGTSRISVELSNKDSVKGHFESSILGATVEFDRVNYWTLSENEQNKLILDTVHRIATHCAKQYNWDQDRFNTAYRKVVESDYIFEYELKRKSSKNRKHKASIIVSTNVEYTSIIAVFYDKLESEISRVELLKTYQHEMFYGELIRNYKWYNNEEFGVQLKHGGLKIKTSIDSIIAQVLLSSTELMSKESIKEYFDMIEYKEGH